MGYVRKSLPNVPRICGECENCTPYKVPLPWRPGMPRGQHVVRYYCNFDHHSAHDSKGRHTAVQPKEPPPIKSDGTPFCPKAMGYQEQISVTGSEIGSFAGHSGDEAEHTYSGFPIDDEGWRLVQRSFSTNHDSFVKKKGQKEKIRIVTDRGTVLREIVPC